MHAPSDPRRMMGEILNRSALPVPSDGVHRILGQRLGPDSFAELGWTVLRNDPPIDPRFPRVEADFVLADPRQGIVLVQIAPAVQPQAADQLRQRLDAVGFAEAVAGFLPIVTVQLQDGDVWRLTGLLDVALAAEPPIDVQGDWVPQAQRALLAVLDDPAVAPVPAPPGLAGSAALPGPAPTSPPLPLPEERQPLAPASRPPRQSRLRPLHLFWATAMLASGATLGLLHYLGPPREPTAPAALQAELQQPAPPRAVEPPAPRDAAPRPPEASSAAPVRQAWPAPQPALPAEQLAFDALPLPPPPAPPRPAPALLARSAPEARLPPEPGFAPEPGLGVEPLVATPPELPPGWFVARPPESDRSWNQDGESWRTPEAAESGGPSRIFVHHHRSRRDLAESVAGRAYGLGGSVEIRAVPATPPNGEIRYFNPGDRGLAERLAGTLGGSFRLRDFTAFSPRPSRGTMEVWVPGRADSWD